MSKILNIIESYTSAADIARGITRATPVVVAPTPISPQDLTKVLLKIGTTDIVGTQGFDLSNPFDLFNLDNVSGIITLFNIDSDNMRYSVTDGFTFSKSPYIYESISEQRYARKDTENTFTQNQTFLGNVDVLGDFNVRNTVDLSISDNIIDLNKGENGSGVTTGYAGIQIDRGSLSSKGLIFDESDDKIKFGNFDTRQGNIVTVQSDGFIIDGLDTSENLTGKEVKIFTADEIARIFVVSGWNNVTKKLTVTGSTSGIDNTWKWRLLITKDISPLAILGDSLTVDNGVVWDGTKLVDAGYKWALKNGDVNENFNVKDAKCNRLIVGSSGIVGSGSGIFNLAEDGEYWKYKGEDFYLNKNDSIIARTNGKLNALSFESINYQSGLIGQGFSFAENSECNNLFIREMFTVNTFVNNKINITNGDMIVSDSDTIDLIDPTTFYFKDEHPFSIGDKLRCQQFNGTTLNVYFLNVTAIGHSVAHPGYSYIKATKTGSGTPVVGDLLARWNGGLLYLNSSDDVNGAYLDVLLDGIAKVRLGNLIGINDAELGQLSGYGLYGDNVFLKGKMLLSSGSSIDFADLRNTGNTFTHIDANGIYTGSLTAQQVNAVDINADSIKSGSINAIDITGSTITGGSLIGATISTTSGKFSVDDNGILSATDGNFNGTITSTNGTIGGFSLDDNEIKSTNINLNSSTGFISFYGFNQGIKFGSDANNITGGLYSSSFGAGSIFMQSDNILDLQGGERSASATFTRIALDSDKISFKYKDTEKLRITEDESWFTGGNVKISYDCEIGGKLKVDTVSKKVISYSSGTILNSNVSTHILRTSLDNQIFYLPLISETEDGTEITIVNANYYNSDIYASTASPINSGDSGTKQTSGKWIDLDQRRSWARFVKYIDRWYHTGYNN